MRKIKELLNLDGRVYVLVDSANVRRIFLENAQAEGFRFKDGKKPTKRKTYDNIYAINKDFTINFVGFYGHMAFENPSDCVGENIIRVDYAAYISGSKEYIL